MESVNSCKQNKFVINFSMNLFVHVIFLFTILSVLFIFVIAKISSDAINNEIIHLVNENINEHYSKFNDNQRNVFKNILNVMPLDKLSKYYDQPEKVRDTNNKHVFNSMKLTIVLLLILLIIIVIVSRLLCHQIPMKHIIVENSIIFTGIGVVEFLFFKNIILKYIPIQPSFLLTYLFNSVKNKIL
jgi:hypothetical protein